MKFFVYGTLKRAFGNHRILQHGGAAFLGRAVTLDPYVMENVGFPFVWQHDEGWPVAGELFDIGDAIFQPAKTTLYQLDRLEANGRMYQRRQRSVRMLTGPNSETLLPVCDAEIHRDVWIYECLRERRPSRDESCVRECLGEDNRLEWEPVRSRSIKRRDVA